VSQGGAAGSAVIVGGSAGAAGAAAGATGAAGAAGSGGALPTDPGELLYFNNCQLCHGANGVGGPLAPEVQHPVTDHATWVVRNGLPGVGYVKPMEPIAADKLSEADLALIWGFLDKPPQPTTAEGLYKDYCGNCHGADGKGGPTTRDITNELAELRDIVRDGAHPGEFELRNEYMPALPSTVLTDAEVDLIYAYVESL
jgi:mono/diheme cytochrome c family protein